VIKRRWLLLIICGFIFAAGLALGPGGWLPSAYANVTLVSFTATYLPGTQEMRIEWETATEFDTVGFFIARGDISSGPFAQVSPFIQHEGDSVVGAVYEFTDETTELNQTYYYRLEVINTDQTIDYHGPITATTGVPAAGTATPTRTSTFTATPTRTPTPTATPTTQPDTEDVDPPAASDDRIVATPRAATGATITPRPTMASGSSNPVAFAVTPTLVSSTNDCSCARQPIHPCRLFLMPRSRRLPCAASRRAECSATAGADSRTCGSGPGYRRAGRCRHGGSAARRVGELHA
jgi:hypothetical protein